LITPQIWASQWFPLTGISKVCEAYTQCDLVIGEEGENGGNNDGDTISKEKVIEVVDNFVMTCKYNSTNQNLYKDLSDWDNSMYMYDFQYRYPQINWMNKIDSVSLVVGATGCKEKITDDVVDWYILQKEKDNVFTRTETEEDMVFNIHQSIASNVESVLNWHYQNPDSLVGTRIYPYHQNIAIKMDSIEDVNNAINLRSLQLAQAVVDELDRLQSRYSFLVETKKVWTLEMKSVISGLGSITPQEWADIQRIAGLCPLEYGSVVYDAWSLLDVGGKEPQELDFDLNCAQNLLPRSTEVLNSGSIYPNPTEGIININFQHDQFDAVMVYNAMGEEVFNLRLQENEKISSIDLNHLKNGMYFIRFEKVKSIIHSEKFILMK
jgi:hypothetical protein